MSEIDDAKKFLTGLETFVKGLEGAKSLLKILEDAEGSITSKKANLEALAKENERLSGKRAQIDDALSMKRQEASDELARLTADTDSRKESLREGLRTFIADCSGQRSQAQADLEAKQAELGAARADLSSAKSELAEIQSELVALRKKFAS